MEDRILLRSSSIALIAMDSSRVCVDVCLIFRLTWRAGKGKESDRLLSLEAVVVLMRLIVNLFTEIPLFGTNNDRV